MPPARPAPERFWEKVDLDGPVPAHRPELGPCWLWIASLKFGYGQFGAVGGKAPVRAHRYAYEALVGPVPAGLQLDHLCRVRRCVNPAHLEPVTCRANLLRGETVTARNASATRCPRGHPYDEANTYRWSDGSRHCRECGAANARRYREERATV